MTPILACNTAGITPFVPSDNDPWDIYRARHVYRRLGFGAPLAILNLALTKEPQDLIDALVDEARDLPNNSAPYWATWDKTDFSNYDKQNAEYVELLRYQAITDILDKGLKARMSFFWVNHFVARLNDFNHSPYLFQYNDLIQTHCLGNFKDFVHEVGLSNAMLVFLNGFDNVKVSPNENYARELFELFTLGHDDGYTQRDIEEASRAFTGYNNVKEQGAEIKFSQEDFDDGAKTIFGQTGNWDYHQVIDILFEQRGKTIARFIAGKLYDFFIGPDRNMEIVETMARTFIDEKFEIAPMLRQLFKSSHFFDGGALGSIIKSPYDITCTFINEVDFKYTDRDNGFYKLLLHITGGLLGQRYFNPPDVAGWQRDRTWITSSTLTGRWYGMDYIAYQMWDLDQEQYRRFAKDLTGNSTDTALITRKILDYFLCKPLYEEKDYRIAEQVLRWDIPLNYYNDGKWNLDWNSGGYQVFQLFLHMFRIPEFQLK